MYDNAELDTTFSERACQVWVHPTAQSSTSNRVRPRLKKVRDGRREAWALVLTEEFEGKIQTALALGRTHTRAIHEVKKWKHDLLLKLADTTGSLESLTHRLNVKRLEIQPNKEPTMLQKKTLENLAQGVERLKANQNLWNKRIATWDSNLARGLDRWRKAWTDVDRTLARVWTDAGRLVADDNSDTGNERPPKATDSKNEAERKRGQSNRNGNEIR